jgi:hypothetical protein
MNVVCLPFCVWLSPLTAAVQTYFCVVTRLLLPRDEDNPVLVKSVLPTTCGSALQYGKSWQVITLNTPSTASALHLARCLISLPQAQFQCHCSAG